MSSQLAPFTVSPQEAGFTLAKVLRARLGGPSWGDVRKLIAARRVKVGDAICSDEARRLKENEVVVLFEHPKPLPRSAHPERLVVRHLDEHVVVVEKPSGVNTVRHPAELEWSESRRELDPTLEDLTQWAVAHQLNRNPRDAAATPHRPPARQGDERAGRVRALCPCRARTRAPVPQPHRRAAIPGGRPGIPPAADDLLEPRGGPRRRPPRQHAASRGGKGSGHARLGRGTAERLHRCSRAGSLPAARTRSAFTSPMPGTRSAATRCT